MKLATPLWLAALPVLLTILIGLWTWSGRRARRRLAAAFPTPWLEQFLRSVSPIRRRTRLVLIGLGFAALVLALARPQWGRQEIELERTGVDLVIALDVSRSMLAADAGGTNRLATAVGALERLLASLGGDRVGLILFAGEAYLAAPLTRDHVAISRALAAVSPWMVSEQGSDLGKAIRRARESFDRAAPGPRTLLVLSDGEQLQGDAVEAASAAPRDGTRVHTAGVGSAGGARLPRNAWERDSVIKNTAGRDVVSRRDEQQLQRIAAAGGGRYTRLAGPDSRALADWYEGVIAPLAQVTEKRLVDEPREQYQWPMLVGFGLMTAAWLLGERRRPPVGARPAEGGRIREWEKRQRPGALQKDARSAEGGRSLEGEKRQGAGALQEEGRPAECGRMLGRLLGGLVIVAASAEGGAAVQENSTSPWDRYNVGIEAYAAGEFVRAEAAWQDLALESLPRTLRRPVWFQLGNARFRLGEGLEPTAPEEAVELWRRSLESYRQALSLKPRDAAVRHNLGLVERRLATRLHALGLEAFNSAANKARDEAITLLRTAVTDLDEAALLAPGDSVIREDRDRARDTLRERLLDRAEQAERRGDEEARQQASWADRQAAERYHEALEDIRESSSATTVPRAEQARERVTRKLADLLARMGQREQRAGQSLAQANPDEALDRFETALAHFQEAQSTQPGHAAAERGEREVRQAMQRLHVQEGQDALRQGREQLERGNPQAAPSLTTALGHFEAALSLNPNNVPAQKGADEARQLLPDALALAGENAMRAGDRAETADPGEALNQYQEAESNFQQALDQEPDHTRASQGLEALEPRLARMRQRLEQEGQQASASNRRTPSLDSLLDQVSEREPTPFEDRQRQPARNRPGERRQPRDW